jgi:hypothetical protein
MREGYPGRKGRSSWPVECMGHDTLSRKRFTLHTFTPRAPPPWRDPNGFATDGPRPRGLRRPAALRERGGVALHAHQRAGAGRVRAGRAGGVGRTPARRQPGRSVWPCSARWPAGCWCTTGSPGSVHRSGDRRAGSHSAARDVPGAEAMVGRVQEGGDALVRLNDAFLPDAVLLDVPAAWWCPTPSWSCTGATGPRERATARRLPAHLRPARGQRPGVGGRGLRREPRRPAPWWCR